MASLESPVWSLFSPAVCYLVSENYSSDPYSIRNWISFLLLLLDVCGILFPCHNIIICQLTIASALLFGFLSLTESRTFSGSIIRSCSMSMRFITSSFVFADFIHLPARSPILASDSVTDSPSFNFVDLNCQRYNSPQLCHTASR